MAFANDLIGDVWLIYKSEEDPGMWVAHSLTTNQIALGDSVLEAYVAMRGVMRTFWAAYAEDNSIILEQAPADVCARLEDAKPLEQSLLDRASEILDRRRIPLPTGDLFKTFDVEAPATAR